jgi:predicted PolB exonuclease-like 3'-5' exonuclease
MKSLFNVQIKAKNQQYQQKGAKLLPHCCSVIVSASELF